MIINVPKVLPKPLPPKFIPCAPSKTGCSNSNHSSEEKKQSDSLAPLSSGKVLTLEKLPRQLVNIDYPVRGRIVDLANQLQTELDSHPEQFQRFHEIISANIGNPQAVGRKPITFNRQVLVCLLNPTLLDDNSNNQSSPNNNNNKALFPFPEDVKERARRYLKEIPELGAYSESRGNSLFRRDIAAWFKCRDGFECNPESIFLTDGASSAVLLILELLINKPSAGILIPVPQYPLYSATITRLNGTVVPYFLDEENGWKLTSNELQHAVDESSKEEVDCRALVVINPGNPTSSLLGRDEIVDVIRFCEKERLVLIADEVYQDNVYRENFSFVSFRKVAKELNSPVELVSLYSSSKSFAGECGVRGGLMQLENINQDVIAVLVRLMSLSLCSNTVGQAMLACILNPPVPGQPSYHQFNEEVEKVFNELKRRASITPKRLNQLEGVSCQPIDASMYAFPKIDIPQKAIEVAMQKGIQPDLLYCIELLEYSGIICVPGSGFRQKQGTYHIRFTILPSCLDRMLESLSQFHIAFLKKYSC